MLSSENQFPALKIAQQSPVIATDPSLTMELLELELSLENLTDDTGDFTARVRKAAADVEGAYLFELPASGLVDNCTRIAVLRIPTGDDAAMAMIFACLEPDGVTIRIEQADEKTADLKNFAEAFVDVFRRI